MLVDAFVLILQGAEGVACEPQIAKLGIVFGIVDRVSEESLTIIICGVDGDVVVVYGLLRSFVFASALVGGTDFGFELFALVVEFDACRGRDSCRIVVAKGGRQVS